MSPSPFSLLAVIVCVFLLFPLGAVALEWEAVPSVGLRTEYNDNVRLTTVSQESVWGYTASPRLKVNALDEDGGLKGDFRFEPARYPGDDELDSNNWFVNLDSYYFSEFNRWDLGVAYTQDSTIQSELLDTGFTNVSKTRVQKSIAPSWQYTLSEYSSLDLGYRYSETGYEDAGTIGLFDYDVGTVSGVATHLLTEFDYLSATLYYTAFNAPDARSEFDDKGIKIGFSHVYSEHYRFDVTAGARRTKYNNLARKNESSTGFVGELSLSRQFEFGSVQGSVERRIDPSGAGYLMQRDSFVFQLTRKFTSLLNGSLNTGVYRNKSLQLDDTRLDRTYFSFAPRLTWRLTKRWSSRLFFRYVYSKYDNAIDEAQANVLGASVLYRWPSPLSAD